jgi:succinoglycan biosynthesis transport protein ExoP
MPKGMPCLRTSTPAWQGILTCWFTRARQACSLRWSGEFGRACPGELFPTIDLTRLPLKPDFPNRIKLCGIGLGIGLALGTLLTGGAEYLDDRIHDEKALEELLPVPMLSETPVITTQAEKRRQQRRLWLTWVLAGFVFATILAGSAVSLLWG